MRNLGIVHELTKRLDIKSNVRPGMGEKIKFFHIASVEFRIGINFSIRRELEIEGEKE